MSESELVIDTINSFVCILFAIAFYKYKLRHDILWDD